MRLRDQFEISGVVKIRTHESGYEYSRESYRSGELIHEDHNAVQAPGVSYILQMLRSSPARVGITQIGLHDPGAVQQFKGDLTDQYVGGGNTLVNVLYLTTLQPVGQPVNLNQARLYMDAGGTTLLAIATFGTFNKNTSLAVTFEWTVALSGV